MDWSLAWVRYNVREPEYLECPWERIIQAETCSRNPIQSSRLLYKYRLM